MSHNRALSIELAVTPTYLGINSLSFSYTKGFNSHKELSFERSYTRILSRLADFKSVPTHAV